MLASYDFTDLNAMENNFLGAPVNSWLCWLLMFFFYYYFSKILNSEKVKSWSKL